MMESTATWMEERVADDIDDNRQYLQYSQLKSPFVPLDAFSSTYGFQYGNWIFWEYLSQAYCQGIVKKAWKAAGSLRKDGGRYSVQALQSVLRRKGGLTDVYADFAAANTMPGLVYEEGAAYGDTPPLAEATLTRRSRTWKQAARIDHLAGNSVRLHPGPDLGREEVAPAGAGRRPLPRVLAGRDAAGAQDRRPRHEEVRVQLDRRGSGTTTVPFSAARCGTVTVSLANVSTRYRLRPEDVAGVRGRLARDDNQKFTVDAKAVKKATRRH